VTISCIQKIEERNVLQQGLLNFTIMESKEQAYFIDACRRGDVNEVRQLCSMFPDLINAQDAKGFTPLIIAVYNHQVEVTAVLLENEADVNVQDFSGNTALMGTCFKGYADLAEKLLEAGADVNIRNGQGAPALTFAATFGQLEIAEKLMQKGAVIDFQDARGKTPLDHARLQENDAMVALIEKYISQQ
jgi:ankyrin repeat protein